MTGWRIRPAAVEGLTCEEKAWQVIEEIWMDPRQEVLDRLPSAAEEELEGLGDEFYDLLDVRSILDQLPMLRSD